MVYQRRDDWLLWSQAEAVAARLQMSMSAAVAAALRAWIEQEATRDPEGIGRMLDPGDSHV